MKLTLQIFLLLFSSVIYAQNDFKVSTEGFKFEEYNSRNKKLKIYFSAKNIGSNEPWNGNTKDFILYPGNSPDRRFTANEYIPIISNEKTINNKTYFSLIYNIPIDAYQLKFKYPKKYGGLIISIPDSNKKKSGNILKPDFTNYVGYGLSFDVGAFNLENHNFSTLSIGIEFLPKLYSFGKKKQSLVFSNLSFNWGGIFGMDANKIESSYKTDSSQYRITDQVVADSSGMNFMTYGGGIGVYFSKGEIISPMLNVSIVNTTMIPLKMNITDKRTNKVSEFSTYSGWGFKIDAGVEIVKNFLVAYTFRYFKPDSQYDFLNKIHRFHTLKIAIWGWE
ncbi:MAG: hypothetical protein IPG09_10130 [Ignavibacteria bacterium]|nr:hypothetical protein [Ignavibacteria bacterium]